MTSKILLGFCILFSAQLVRSQNVTFQSDFMGGLEEPEDPHMEEEDEILFRKWRADSIDGREIAAEIFPIDKKTLIYELDGSRRPTDLALGHFSRLNNSYFLLAPILARPSSVYRVVILPFRAEDQNQQIDVKASLSSSTGNEITFAHSRALVGETTELLMKLPDNLPGPYLRLRVEGSQGSNIMFVNTTLVHPSKDFLTIITQMSRAVFTGDQQVEFRIILLKMDMLPYQEPVDIFILDPAGYIVRRWVSRVPNTGVVELDFRTPPIPAGGFWRIRIQAGTQRKEHPFLVIKYYIPRFEIFFDLAPYTLLSDEAIEVEISAAITNDAPLLGNMTVNVYAKYPWNLPDSEYRHVTTEVFDYFPSEASLTLPLTMLQGIVSNPVGTEVKITSSVFDTFTGITVDGYAKTRIIDGNVKVNFLGPSPVIFRPGMPLTLTINIAYEDDQSLDPEKLKESSLRITSVANTRTGTKTLREIYITPMRNEENEAAAFLSVNSILGEATFLSVNSMRGEENMTGRALDDDYWYGRKMLESMLAKEMYILRSKFSDYRKTGVFSFTLEIPADAVSLTISASFMDYEGNTAGSVLDGKVNFSPENRQLHITSSTDRGIVGEFAIFHVRSNFMMTKFHYIILCKGVLIHSATEAVPFAGTENVATIGVAISKEMFPVFTFVAFYADHQGNIAVDSIVIPVQIAHLLPAKVYLNQHKDHSKATVEAFFTGPPGTFIFISSSRQAAYALQPRSRLTEAKFLQACLNLEPFPRTISKVRLVPRNSADAEGLKIYSSGDVGGEAYVTLQLSALIPLSDTRFETSSPMLGHCEASLGYFECGDGSCYRYREVCDGVLNCADGSDEMFCGTQQYLPKTSSMDGIEDSEIYHLLRQSWWKDLFDTGDGSFAWHSEFIGHSRNEGTNLGVPATQDEWVVDAFAINAELGFVILPSMPYTSDPPFFIVLDGPSVCRRGEQISIRTAIFNSLDKDLIAMLILPASDDYLFVHVEEKGVVAGYNPRTSGGEHHHLVFVPAGQTIEVFIPIAIVIQTGILEVTIQLTSQIAKFEETMEIEVKPEGAPVRKHTSVLLDLKSRAVLYEFMDIPIDESPIISNTLSRRFLFGSPEVKLTLSGDVFGPISEGITMQFEDAFNGRSFKSSDGLAFNFGTTIWTLHYLRLTNQLNVTDAVNTFKFLNVQMAGLLARFKDGGYKMWHYSGPSVWLTAWVTQLLNTALLEDWENYLYVDPRILNDAAVFLLRYQSPNGDFYETDSFNTTLDYKYSSMYKTNARNVSIGLTAMVMSTLQELLPTLPGQTRPDTIGAIWRATKFLERSLEMMTNPYDIAITTWALTVVGSPAKDVAVSLLLQKKRTRDGFIYWARQDVATNDRNFENNQRTFLLPREPQEWDADAIETTSYALLALLSREGVTMRQERVVNWLVSLRDYDFAFAATVDTVVALRALTEYCYRARLRDVTNIKIEVESSSTRAFSENILIQQPFVSAMQSIQIPNPWGHVLLTGRGSGQALAQLTLTWGVDVREFLEKPAGKYFDLYVREYHHPARNKSRITTTICTRWTGTNISETSHATMLEVEIPTGYQLHQKAANKIVRTAKGGKNFPELFDSLVTDSYIYFQFSHIPNYEQCFKYDINRWYPVANLTFIRSAMIFELFAPEHFEQVILNSTTLNALDICEVCGSFQCPYCPFYSEAPSIHVYPLLIIAQILLIHAALKWLLTDAIPSNEDLSFR